MRGLRYACKASMGRSAGERRTERGIVKWKKSRFEQNSVHESLGYARELYASIHPPATASAAMATACPRTTRDPAGAPFAKALVLLVWVGNGTFCPDWKMVVGPFGPRVDEPAVKSPLGIELVADETVLKVSEGVVAVKREPTPPLRPPVEVTTAEESEVVEVEVVEVSEESEVVEVSEDVVESVVTTVPAVAQ